MPNKKITKKKTGKKKPTKKKAGKKKVSKKKVRKIKSAKSAPKIPIPEALQKKDIKKVTDNIPKGGRLDVSADDFMAIFGNALLEHYTPKDEDDDKEKK